MFSGICVKIGSGPLKGKMWSITSGYKFIRGNYEQYKTDAFIKDFKPGTIFFDIGAHIGYYSLLGAVINKGDGHIFAFEPRPLNINFFKRHVKKNNIKNVTLIEAAAGQSDGYVKFDDNHGSATGFVSEKGDMVVRQVSIAKLVAERSLPMPGFIKIDVEGGEIDVLTDLNGIIASGRPKMLIATHGARYRDFTEDFLKKTTTATVS